MKTVAMANMKGGVGKTSLSVTLAAELAKTDKTALLDFDPQANTTAWVAPESAAIDIELADVLQGKATVRDSFITTDIERLFLLPTYGNGGLKGYVENAGELQINKAVKTLIGDIAKMNYAYCVIDLSPAFGKLERAALITATEAVTPILADRFSLDGLETIAANLDELRGLVESPIAEYRRIIVNGMDGRIKRHAVILDSLKKGAKQSLYTIPIDQVFFRAQNESRAIQTMDAKPETLREMARLADDIRGTK